MDLTYPGSLPRAWCSWWERHPGQPVLGQHDRWITAAELEDRARRVAGRLGGSGLMPGDRIVISAATSLDLAVAVVGAIRLGLVVVPVNPSFQEREVATIVRDARPRAAVVDAPEQAAWIDAATPGLVVVDPSVDLPEADPPEIDSSEVDDAVFIAYTSGTTGAPKGARLTHGNILASVNAGIRAWRWAPDDRLVLCLPLFHQHGLGVALIGTLVAGASVVMLDRFSVDGLLDAAAAHAATLFFGTPPMYARLGSSSRLPDIGSFRLCTSGSAALPSALHGTIAEAGQVVLERYGLTETGLSISNPYDGERRPGTVGLPLPGMELRLDGDPVSGQPGEILLRGPGVIERYWSAGPGASDAFGSDGWFRTGDVGAFDTAGYLRVVGRCKEMIITGGYNVYPREVEEVLVEHPAVREAAVVGLPSSQLGEKIVAFVVCDAATTVREIRSHLATSLAPYKRPKIVRIVDVLPRNPMGKVRKEELRALV